MGGVRCRLFSLSMVVSQLDYHAIAYSRYADGRIPLLGGGITVAALGAASELFAFCCVRRCAWARISRKSPSFPSRFPFFCGLMDFGRWLRSEEHTSELQSR